MAGPDLPPAGSGDTSPKQPPGPSRKRKRGADAGLPVRVTRSSSAEARQGADEATVAGVGLPRRVTRRSASSQKVLGEAAVADAVLTRRVTRSSPSSRQAVPEPANADAGLPRRVTRSLASSPQTVDEPAVADAGLTRRVTRSSPSSRQVVDEAAIADAGLPRRVTRSVASSRQAVDETTVAGAVRLARSVAVGTPWKGRGLGLGRGIVDVEVERMRKVVLKVRQAILVDLEPDDPDSPYTKKRKIHRSGSRSSQRIACQITYLSRFPKKHIGKDPVEHLASVPEWKNAASEEHTADYKSETFLQKLGTIVHPLNINISTTDEPEKMRIEMVDKCNCSCPGSADCVQVHVEKARSWIKDQLGEEAFRDCGLDAMGGQVLELWSAEDKSKLDDIDKLIPHNQHQRFMKIASEQLSQSKAKDLAKYYYNVFLPRRLASLTRAEPKEDKDVDTDDEASAKDDKNTGHHSGKKNKGVSLLPKRCRK